MSDKNKLGVVLYFGTMVAFIAFFVGYFVALANNLDSGVSWAVFFSVLGCVFFAAHLFFLVNLIVEWVKSKND